MKAGRIGARATLVALIMLASVFLMGVTDSAAPMVMHYENFTCAPAMLSVYVTSDRELTKNDITVTLSGQSLPVTGITTVADDGGGVSYLFAVDVSGSIRSSRMYMIHAALTAFAQQMSDVDNASFMTIGNDAVYTPFMSGGEEMLDYIAGLQAKGEDTNLYKGIVTAARLMQTDTAVKSKRCIIVFSDGEDDIVDGYTREEAQSAVDDSNVPVFTLAIMDRYPENEVTEGAKVLSSLARGSAGGVALTLRQGEDDPEEVAAAVHDVVMNGLILQLDLTGITLPNDQCLLEIRAASGGQSATDSALLSAAELRGYIPVPDAEPETPQEPESAETKQSGNVLSEDDTAEDGSPPKKESSEEESAENDSTVQDVEEQDGFQRYLPYVIGGGVLLVIVVCVIIAAARKRGEDTAPVEVPQSVFVPQATVISAAPVARVARRKPKWVFTFTKLGLHETKKFSVGVDAELIIGREVADMSVPADQRLSSRHCRIFMHNGVFFIEDMASTNGTYLNGVPVKRPCPIEQDSILLIGSMELRVTWRAVE